jgi:hypothetical protein
MTAERSRAYAHVLAMLGDLGPAKLHADEQAAVREAADALLFCSDVAADDEARAALDRLDDVVDRLVANDRLQLETGDALVDAVEACGPPRVMSGAVSGRG